MTDFIALLLALFGLDPEPPPPTPDHSTAEILDK